MHFFKYQSHYVLRNQVVHKHFYSILWPNCVCLQLSELRLVGCSWLLCAYEYPSRGTTLYKNILDFLRFCFGIWKAIGKSESILWRPLFIDATQKADSIDSMNEVLALVRSALNSAYIDLFKVNLKRPSFLYLALITPWLGRLFLTVRFNLRQRMI